MHGVWTALITPFHESSGELDLPAFRKIIQDQREAKVNGVVICGTTGESPALSLEEKKLLIHTALEELKGSATRVLAGTGTYNTQESVEFSRWASDQGVDGILTVVPYYNKPTQAGIEAHFRAIADAVQCEVVLYNIPGRSGVGMTTETIAKLATHPRIRSIKEASGNVSFTSDLIDVLTSRNLNMDIVSGDDGIYLPLLSVGAVGVISVASNLFPRAMVSIQAAMDRGDWKEASRIHRHYFPLFRDLFVETNPVPIKTALAYAGWCSKRVRLPMSPLLPASEKRLHESLSRCEIPEGKRSAL